MVPLPYLWDKSSTRGFPLKHLSHVSQEEVKYFTGASTMEKITSGSWKGENQVSSSLKCN